MQRKDVKVSILKRYFEEDDGGLHAATTAVEPLPGETVDDLVWRCLMWSPNGYPNPLGVLEVRIIEPARKAEE